ncbi:MAG: hypothetical protein ACXAC7_17965 [Candidatus Hodarchaeales archaeon]|jgi:hypothetical protein
MTEDFPEKDYAGELAAQGVQGLFVITKDGIPVVERYYQEAEMFQQDHSYLVGGFFSALAKFASELTQGSLLSDVGFHTIRIYIDHTLEILFLLVFDETRLQQLATEDVRVLLKGTLASVKSVFQAYFGEEEMNALKNPLEFKNLRDTLENLGETLDRMLYESYNETLSMFQGDGSPF